MLPYTTIIIYFEINWSYPNPDTRGRAYWANRLQTLHNEKMAQGREHAEAIRDCQREYFASRGKRFLA